jgi:hypothetical protein
MIDALKKCSPDAPTTGELHAAVGATAMHLYAMEAETGKHRFDPPQTTGKQAILRDGTEYRRVTFRASGGRIWAYRGKRGRVLAMLATMPDGVTQWDCYPWHTRLAASVKVLRDDGIEIETTRERTFHHARYRLRTPGALLLQGQTA